MEFNIIKLLLLLVFFVISVSAQLCPKQCDCDMKNELNSATCTNQNIVTIDIGVPKQVQMYTLSYNALNELDNYVFKEIGYTSLIVLNLSYNHIFWIGIHAFSGLTKLSDLNLSNNRLNYVPSDVFSETPELEHLDLSGNIFKSLPNEPFLMHDKLKTLNLRNCRMKSLPDRMFVRLPNLRKLDLRDNYMITLNKEVLLPLKKLERLELKSSYWKCNKEFIALEEWILSQEVVYEKHCRAMPKMFERMISVVSNETSEEVNVTDVWVIPKTVDTNSTTITNNNNTKKLTPFETFEREFSSLQAFILGAEIGLGIGIVGTYLWLRRVCKCSAIKFRRIETRRQRMRRIRMENDMTANLLYITTPNPNLETPPSMRRDLSLPDFASAVPNYGLHSMREASALYDVIRPGTCETPPPPYNECRRIEMI